MQKSVVYTIIAVFSVVFISLAGCIWYLHDQNNSLQQDATSTQQTNTNPDGTSKDAVYTTIDDFGNYSQWAQQQLQAGFSMCTLQNKLAETDSVVPMNPDCDGNTLNSGINCTTISAGVEATTHCTNP